MEAQRYQVTQNGKEYILSTNIINNKIRIECQDNNFPTKPKYTRDYTLLDLSSFSEIFTLVHSINEAQNELNNAIERQQVRITNTGELMEIIFNVQVDTYAQELTFQLPLKQKLSTNYIQSPQSTTTTANPQISPQIVLHKPIYKETTQLVEYGTTNAQEEDDYPDVTYSTKGPTQVYQENPNPGCGCIQDHYRINKIESDEHLLKKDHERLKQRLNDLKMKIQMIKKETNDIRTENGILNMKTLELKKQYNNLLEAEAALRTENDDLKREKHELILKKNELGFYSSDPHSHDTVREVNIPIDGKRRRPTNVSKAEKQFGGGYTSKKSYKDTSEDAVYNSAYANNRGL